MKPTFILALVLISFSANSQSWEEIKTDYTSVYDISNHANKLFLTGRKGGNFIFSYSNDNGATWNEKVLDDYISVELGVPITVGFFNADVGIIGIKGNLSKEYLKTEDGGLTWESYNLNLGIQCDYVPQPWGITIVNNTTAIIQHFQSGNFIITYDSGNSWECSFGFTTSWLPKIAVLNSNTYLNFDNSGLYKSTDEGQTWLTILEIEDISTYSMYNENAGFAVSAYYKSVNSDPELYVTSDGWTTFVTTVLPELNDKLITAIAPVTSEELFFFEAENIYYSSNAGQSVSFFQELSFEPTLLKNVNGEWYATGRGLAKYNPDGVVTGIDKLSQLDDISLFPNPVTNSMIELNTSTFFSYQLLNVNGKLIEEGIIDNGRISIKSEVKGMHYLRIKNKNQSKEKSFKILIN